MRNSSTSASEVKILIVAECNVNMYGKASAGNGYIILIVAECNVNHNSKAIGVYK